MSASMGGAMPAGGAAMPAGPMMPFGPAGLSGAHVAYRCVDAGTGL